MRDGIHTGNPRQFPPPERGEEFLQDIYILPLSICTREPTGLVGRCGILPVTAGLVRDSPYRCLDARCYRGARFLGGEGMDVIYLLILAGLYVVSHGLVWALGRLGKSP